MEDYGHSAMALPSIHISRGKVANRACQNPAGEEAVGEGGRFKGQAVGATDSDEFVTFH